MYQSEIYGHLFALGRLGDGVVFVQLNNDSRQLKVGPLTRYEILRDGKVAFFTTDKPELGFEPSNIFTVDSATSTMAAGHGQEPFRRVPSALDHPIGRAPGVDTGIERPFDISSSGE
jgi:hypothetical protein